MDFNEALEQFKENIKDSNRKVIILTTWPDKIKNQMLFSRNLINIDNWLEIFGIIELQRQEFERIRNASNSVVVIDNKSKN